MRRIITGLLLTGVVITMAGADTLEQAADHPTATGLLVTEVAPGSPAATAGLRPGDIVVSYAGSPIRTQDALTQLAQKHRSAEKIELRLVRDGEQRTVTLPRGPLGLGGTSVAKGKPLARVAETPFLPDWSALRSGDTHYHFLFGGKKAGFERRRLTARGDAIELDQVVRFKMPGFAADLHTRLTLDRKKYLPARLLLFTEGDEVVSDLTREGALLKGKAMGAAAHIQAPPDLVSSYAAYLVALTMPRKVGAGLHFTMLNEGEGSLLTRCDLHCAGKETVTADRKSYEAYRYEITRYGAMLNRLWITADHRLVKADYSGPTGELTDRAGALANLPAGVNTQLPE